MTYGRRRRSKSAGGQIAGDVAYIANRLAWRWALVFGALLFGIFYWGVPAWLNSQFGNMSDTALRPAFEALYARRIYWFEWLGIASAIICALVAAYKYATSLYLDSSEERDVSFIGRLIARLFNQQ